MKGENRKVWNLILIAFMVNSCAFSPRMCKSLLEKSLKKKYDMVVIPGVPFENENWSQTMKDRVCWSKYLYDKGIAKNVMYSGSAVYSPFREAVIMSMYAEKIGIRKENIFTETKAEHSTENMYYSYRKARKLGFASITLGSDPFQTRMLRRFTEKIIHDNIGLIPIVADSLRAVELHVTDPEIDYMKAYVKDFIPLPDREGLIKRLRGTWGLDIDTSAYRK